MEALLQQAAEHYGMGHQIQKTIEELSELTTELSRWMQDDDRTDDEKIAEECADVEIVCKYVEILVGAENVARWRMKKLKRLEERMNE